MMRQRLLPILALFMLLTLTVTGSFAAWVYFLAPEPFTNPISTDLADFTYGLIYITDIRPSGSSGTMTKTGETTARANVTLGSNASSTRSFDVTFYNSTNVSYYYDETETLSQNNANIVYTVSGIEQRDEVPAKSFKTLTVTFSYKGSNTASSSLSAELDFKFVVDKGSIGVIVAQTAVTRFADILNNRVADDSYETLETAMNNRGRNSSSVSYIGNVAGAHDSDSELIRDLFTDQFLTMDLDGDGKAEPITLMIKRENLDGNDQTGDNYTYKNLIGMNSNVFGVEMTIYITSEGFSTSKLTVYAASFTKLPGSSEWIQVTPLTKGTATANRYTIGLGSNNSFNTDTWKSDSNKTIDSMVQEAMKALN